MQEGSVMSVQSIHPIALAALSLLIISGAIMSRLLKLGLARDIISSHTRMILQLTAIGFILEWLFELRGLLPAMLWFSFMILAATAAILRASKLKLRNLAIPVAAAVALCAGIHLFLFLVAAGPDVWNAQGIIPIGGMLLGNTMSSMIIGLQEFFQGMHNRVELYDFRRALGQHRVRAALPFLRSALHRSMSPQIATTATIGLVSLPGMMTGQLLGGSSPLTAVSYQIAIMLAIFSTRLTGTALVILCGLYFGTSRYGNLKA